MKKLYHFRVGHDPTTLGYVLPEVAARFGKCTGLGWSLNNSTTPRTLTLSAGHDYASRSEIIRTTLAYFRNTKTFSVLENWRGELKPCYGVNNEVLFAIERAAFPLFGIVAYGVMLLAYTRDEGGDSSGDGGCSSGGIKGIWVQRRSREARTHPSLLDATAAGGVPIHTKPFTTLLDEAQEEASFSREMVMQRSRLCGTLSYFHTRRRDMGGEIGLLQPGVQFLYDMEVPGDVRPRSSDPNVEGFELMTPERIRWEILAGNFKPWSALAVIDFFIRQGITHEENEKDFIEISMRLHRNLGFPVSGASFLMNHLSSEEI